MNDNKLITEDSPFEETKLIISVKEARKKLPQSYQKLTDEEISEIVIKLSLVAKGTIQKQALI